MSILKVNPTRINLLNLKKELKTAQKGHKLLKDKRDGLMQRFMQIIHETRALRIEIDTEVKQALTVYVRASSMITPKLLDAAFLLPEARISIDVTKQSVMSVPIPHFTVSQEGEATSYGFLDTNGDLDVAVTKLEHIFPKLVRLAELEKTIENLAEEIERTRRRTSALENTRIPNLKDTIRFINLRLEEQARDAVVSAMRIKDMISQNA